MCVRVQYFCSWQTFPAEKGPAQNTNVTHVVTRTGEAALCIPESCGNSPSQTHCQEECEGCLPACWDLKEWSELNIDRERERDGNHLGVKLRNSCYSQEMMWCTFCLKGVAANSKCLFWCWKIKGHCVWIHEHEFLSSWRLLYYYTLIWLPSHTLTNCSWVFIQLLT